MHDRMHTIHKKLINYSYKINSYIELYNPPNFSAPKSHPFSPSGMALFKMKYKPTFIYLWVHEHFFA